MASYLAVEAILAAARRSGADAVHPSYGFLAENPDFADACRKASLVFIGPSPSAIRAMGNKAAAKRRMLAAGVPCLPGYDGEDQSERRLVAEAGKIGAPPMIKAGARRWRSRDAIQRRHQKLVEEAPSPAVGPECARMGEIAVRAAKAIDYEGAGTLELLLDAKGDFYFMEMNTRLQVEHLATEAITGLDLDALQLRVAAGEPLRSGRMRAASRYMRSRRDSARRIRMTASFHGVANSSRGQCPRICASSMRWSRAERYLRIAIRRSRSSSGSARRGRRRGESLCAASRARSRLA